MSSISRGLSTAGVVLSNGKVWRSGVGAQKMKLDANGLALVAQPGRCALLKATQKIVSPYRISFPDHVTSAPSNPVNKICLYRNA